MECLDERTETDEQESLPELVHVELLPAQPPFLTLCALVVVLIQRLNRHIDSIRHQFLPVALIE